MRIQLSDHFTYKRLLRFTLSPVIMMVFTSIYGVVDGLFVTNFVGSNSLASINIVMPVVIVVQGFGFMLGTGGSAEVAKTLGMGQKHKAREYFTMMIITIVATGLILSVICYIFMPQICKLLGASDLLMDDCITYGRIQMIGITAFMLQTTFHSFFITAEKPTIGLILTIISGCTNMFLDYLFICVLDMGIAGAALGTICSYFVAGLAPLVYFLLPNNSLLRFTKPKFYPHVLIHSCTNGSSEMVSNISMSVVTFLYNLQLMKLVGEDGVAAITVIMYVNFIFVSMFIGFAIGTAPVIGFNYGAQNHTEMKSLFRKAVTIISITSVAMTLFAQIFASPLATIFVGHKETLLNMTVNAFRIYSISFLLCGFSIFGSSFFTALCNGKVSAAISFLKSFVFQSGMILLLPYVLGLNGVWFAVVAAEILSFIVTLTFIITQRKKYHYI